ncbi:SDR family NAD(P)-dependent oxidoreductase [Ensifer sp. YR511]|uniref:SDR family NAD(P)-dependent oxidoreductase n=1 Tax=Ensifer sp. YR511 TaxID=1855294 RepID=UPI00088A6CEB|nr:SDR family oxidoreductase [Ensifer sp. YR511]SDM52651.1 NAD(P)-dependent dehydrogenase, short-chain alcohol dehydrogenase family [Ensifer sp. YR511]
MAYPRSLVGKTVLVIGGNGAIGAATGRLFADAGATVLITHTPREQGAASADAVISSLANAERHARYAVDITDSRALGDLARTIEQKFGKLDVLVNAAGFTKPIAHRDLDALTDELIDDIFKVNWRSQFAAIRAFAPLLKKSGDGLVVSISSIAAFTGIGSNIAYCAAKAGIDVLTKALARALAPEIRVLAVSPGVVDTQFVPGRGSDFNDKVASSTPLGRIGEVDDIAAAILASATLLGFSTGHIIQVDGGRAL